MKRLDVTRPINHRDIERRQTPQDRAGPATYRCMISYDLHIYWNPTGGTCTISITYDGTAESFTFAYNATHDDVLADVNTHTKFILHSVTASYAGAGSFPSANMVLKLPDDAKITAHTSSLTGASGEPRPEFRCDICGC